MSPFKHRQQLPARQSHNERIEHGDPTRREGEDVISLIVRCTSVCLALSPRFIEGCGPLRSHGSAMLRRSRSTSALTSSFDDLLGLAITLTSPRGSGRYLPIPPLLWPDITERLARSAVAFERTKFVRRGFGARAAPSPCRQQRLR